MSAPSAPGGAPIAAPRAGEAGRRRKQIFLRYSTLAVLVLLFAGFSMGVDRFLTTSNLLNILQQISMLTIVAIGLTFGFAAREMDLSVGFMAGLAGLIGPTLLVAGWPLPVALAAGLGAGLAVGMVNAALVTIVGVPSLIATLAMGSILFGVNFLLSGGRAIYGGLPESYLVLGQGRLFGIPVLAFLMLGAVLVAWFVMERTIFGRYVYAVGGNLKAAELSGIRGRRYRQMALVISSLFAALAGLLLSARLGSGQPNAGQDYLLDGLATVFIGMTMFRPGTATIAGTFFGALFIGVINNGLNLLGLDTYIQSIVKGVIIIVAVAIVSRTTKLKLL